MKRATIVSLLVAFTISGCGGSNEPDVVVVVVDGGGGVDAGAPGGSSRSNSSGSGGTEQIGSGDSLTSSGSGGQDTGSGGTGSGGDAGDPPNPIIATDQFEVSDAKGTYVTCFPAGDLTDFTSIKFEARQRNPVPDTTYKLAVGFDSDLADSPVQDARDYGTEVDVPGDWSEFTISLADLYSRDPVLVDVESVCFVGSGFYVREARYE